MRTFAKVPAHHDVVVPAPRAVGVEVRARATPSDWRYWPAGELGLIEPAGLMWSVVTESPKIASARAPVTSPGAAGRRARRA